MENVTLDGDLRSDGTCTAARKGLCKNNATESLLKIFFHLFYY